jgi:hypothetical protein
MILAPQHHAYLYQKLDLPSSEKLQYYRQATSSDEYNKLQLFQSMASNTLRKAQLELSSPLDSLEDCSANSNEDINDFTLDS